MILSDEELDRYARHIVLREIGGVGQIKLKAASVLVIGAGGIGSPAIQYLAASGIGHLHIVDDDQVDLSNLQRQTLFASGDIGRLKVDAAAERVRALNPNVAVTRHTDRIDASNAEALIRGNDVVLDGCDNFETRLIVADAALKLRVPLVSAAVAEFQGQLGVFRGWEDAQPCYRCFVGDDPAREGVSCSEQGVLGALVGVMGSMGALEVIRAIAPFGEDPVGKLALIDALHFRFRTLKIPKDCGCTACSTIHTGSDQ